MHTRSYGQIVARAALLTNALREAGVRTRSAGRLLSAELAQLGRGIARGLVLTSSRCRGGHAAPRGRSRSLVRHGRGRDRRDRSPTRPSSRENTPCSDSTTRVSSRVNADPGDTDWNTADLSLPASDDLAIALFTSGTTGKPKGITHTHGDVIASLATRGGGLRPYERLPPGSGARAPGARRRLQSVRSHDRLQSHRVPNVDRPSDGDRAPVHGRRGARVARPLRHGCLAAHADDDPHVGDDRRSARSEGREVRDVRYRTLVDRHPRAVRGPLRRAGHAGVRDERGRGRRDRSATTTSWRAGADPARSGGSRRASR